MRCEVKLVITNVNTITYNDLTQLLILSQILGYMKTIKRCNISQQTEELPALRASDLF